MDKEFSIAHPIIIQIKKKQLLGECINIIFLVLFFKEQAETYIIFFSEISVKLIFFS
jgi:hypothetical protein